MARPKNTNTTKKLPKKDHRIQEVYEQDVTFTCPVRGLVTQKVKIKRCKPAMLDNGKYVLQSSDSIDRLEEKDDGLSIYNDGEELGITGEEAGE